MSKEKQQPEPIDADELDEQDGEVLPDREVMSTIDPTGEPIIWELPVEPRSGT
jgi:hypothetical protein